MVETIVRNSDVLFSTTFEDVSSAPVQPTSAVLRIRYRMDRAPITEEIPMGLVDGAWRAIWHSGSADPGMVDWCILGDGNAHGAIQGSIYLAANGANPRAE